MAKKQTRIPFQFPLLGGWLFIFGVWSATPWFVEKQLPKAVSVAASNTPSNAAPPASEQITAGTYGDQFGSTNALFSGLALVAIAVSLWYQRGDMENQRDDIELQRTALVEQKGILEKQLRLTAAPAVMNNLPIITIDILDKGLWFAEISINNIGPDVYDFSAWIDEHPSYTCEKPDTREVFRKDIYKLVLHAHPDKGAIKEAVHVINIQFVILGGQVVKLKYRFVIGDKKPHPEQTWLEVINGVLEELIGTLPTSSSTAPAPKQAAR